MPLGMEVDNHLVMVGTPLDVDKAKEGMPMGKASRLGAATTTKVLDEVVENLTEKEPRQKVEKPRVARKELENKKPRVAINHYNNGRATGQV